MQDNGVPDDEVADGAITENHLRWDLRGLVLVVGFDSRGLRRYKRDRAGGYGDVRVGRGLYVVPGLRQVQLHGLFLDRGYEDFQVYRRGVRLRRNIHKVRQGLAGRQRRRSRIKGIHHPQRSAPAGAVDE